MDRKEAKETLKTFLKEYVERVTSKSKGDMYVCPLCGSGTHTNGTGAFSITKDGLSWKCFSCGKGGDIFDLYGALNHTTDYDEQLLGLCELFNISIDSKGYKKTVKPVKQVKPVMNEHYKHSEVLVDQDLTDFFLEAHKHISETDYPQKRGLSKKVIDQFNLGYVAEWRHPKAPPTSPTSPRLIIPITRYSYLARDTREIEDIPVEQRSYIKSKVKTTQNEISWTFNADALKNAKSPIFVVEGEIDAMSIIEVGGEAVALGSISYIRSFLKLLETNKPSQPLVLALDNDQKGEEATQELMNGLKELNIPFFRYNPAGEYKDANEALQRNREALTLAVLEVADMHEEERNVYVKTSNAYYLKSFVDGIADSVNTEYIPTGFDKLDNVLEGGLYEGLYILGAITSLGKTTFMVQIADHIAQCGHDVLFFSLEMARSEIIAKSISRHTLQESVAKVGGDMYAKTTRGITTGKRYALYSSEEKEIIKECINIYGTYADHIYIIEGVGDIGVDQVRKAVEQHILYTGRAPVVFVDYLQILAPYNEKATDKQNIDKAVIELKRISRDFKIPVLTLSSFNRANYKEAVMEAFKESGAIEYSSDVLFGLQFKGAGSKDFNVNEAKKQDPREVELILLKNRNGRTGDVLNFNFYPKFNYFEEKKEK